MKATQHQTMSMSRVSGMGYGSTLERQSSQLLPKWVSSAIKNSPVAIKLAVGNSIH